MACPRCGGTNRKQIAPGYFVCTTIVERRMPEPDPRFGPFRLQRNECGYEYQEPTSASTFGVCECGMGAIALCKQCGRTLCGNHIAEQSPAVLCQLCAADRQERNRREKLAQLIPTTYENLRKTIPTLADDRRDVFLWQPLRGKELASLIPSRAWSPVRLTATYHTPWYSSRTRYSSVEEMGIGFNNHNDPERGPEYDEYLLESGEVCSTISWTYDSVRTSARRDADALLSAEEVHRIMHAAFPGRQWAFPNMDSFRRGVYGTVPFF